MLIRVLINYFQEIIKKLYIVLIDVSFFFEKIFIFVYKIGLLVFNLIYKIDFYG